MSLIINTDSAETGEPRSGQPGLHPLSKLSVKRAHSTMQMNRTKRFMKAVDMPQPRSMFDDVEVESVPPSASGQVRSFESRKRMEEDAVYCRTEN